MNSQVKEGNTAIPADHQAAAQPSACCPPKKQETCCKASDKSDCCGPQSGRPATSCGCQQDGARR